ncbi:excitatory amino acid transporter 2-like [Lytechinus variegatus]|uniref:excitatory amino acid transporter 2-like n=1 Tax=Lytechinus variegatus TaxID=7654 RepID=UPI001BB28CA0|nr:excitatory amino acid transporter 2-like [Lytechinus variegatus]
MENDKVVDLEIHEDGSRGPETHQGNARRSLRDFRSMGWREIGMVLLTKLRANLLLVLTLASVILGIFFGGVLRNAEPSSTAIKIIGLPGDVLVRLLKMLVLPLIVSSLITGLTSLDTKSCGKLGARALVYYFTTSCVAVIVGIIVVLAIRPGRTGKDHQVDYDERKDDTDPLESFIDILRNLFPSNLVQACFQQAMTVYGIKEKMVLVPNDTFQDANCTWKNASETGMCESVVNGTETTISKSYKDGMNVLGLLVFSIPFGILLSRMGEKGRVMVDFFEILSELTMQLVNIVMWYSPVGIMSLICAKILSMKDLSEVLPTLGLYMLTVVLGLLVHLAILMTIFYATTRTNPFRFFEGILQAWLTAFATASSSATLPVTFRCLEDNLKVDKRVTRFVLPIGATVNMDGTALYEAVATIFIGQMNGFAMPFSKILTISLTATLGSIGAASIPSAGIVTLVLVLTAVGFPIEDVGLLMAVDWFLDRCRTSINVVGDSYGAGIVYHLSKQELDTPDKGEAELEIEEGKENGDLPAGNAETEIEKSVENDGNATKEGSNCDSGV